ncbi:Tropomyosin like [Actinidia chinensis var. chinensis]|uniref:Tropomyosin like n=1 Tax=Actinidia chinensis var. chinensis TaxID=1590841 RepID=A0A2R6QW54_ACTCC|nr:Tropomyosin like [Actinidia chinensis var. chinensis]
MMDSAERPHRSSELFICFTSRLSSSSSMKISSKSAIHSPGRGPVSLSTSLSRRLRSNGSLRGGQSPMFPTSAGKKRGANFENPEPSSPKVTCIGQVRVKTKKQGKKIRTLSKRRGEVSFRRADPNRNQRWVHLQLTICEAVRAFGSEISCLFPCFSRENEERERGEERGKAAGKSSCGAVFARWFVATLQEAEAEGERETAKARERRFERRLGEEIGIGDEKFESNGGDVGEEDEERVSICIPPKNALLLMRCRSDPIRVSALANRFCESPPKCEDEDEEEDEGVYSKVFNGDLKIMEGREVEVCENLVSERNEEETEDPEVEENLVMKVEEGEAEDLEENPEVEKLDSINAEEDDENLEVKMTEEENELDHCSPELVADLEKLETKDALLIQEKEEEEERRASHESSSSVLSVQSYLAIEEEVLAEKATFEEEEEKSTDETETLKFEEEEEEEEEETVTQERESEETQREEVSTDESEENEAERNSILERETMSVLPDCLLLMRCEPKLSMEVSKETWVCSTDFVRWLPERERQGKPTDGHNEPKKRISTDSNPAPPRSSCSVSMAAMIEQRLVNAVAYEPLVLTRCKSEPMRTAAGKLAPETCFWKNRKLEPHGRATVSAAGVGF